MKTKTLTEASSEASKFNSALFDTVMSEPMGAISRDLWEHRRMVELSRAINDYIAFGKLEPVKPWMDELREFVERKTGWVDMKGERMI